MGWRLAEEMLDSLPPEVTPAERMLLTVLALRADDNTRECWPGEEELRRRTGLTTKGLQAVFARLAARGLEVRAPIGTGKDGRSVFAARGHQRTYRLPKVPSEQTLSDPAKGRSEQTLSARKGLPRQAKGSALTGKRVCSDRPLTINEPSGTGAAAPPPAGPVVSKPVRGSELPEAKHSQPPTADDVDPWASEAIDFDDSDGFGMAEILRKRDERDAHTSPSLRAETDSSDEGKSGAEVISIAGRDALRKISEREHDPFWPERATG